jgi:hypothetical protein
MALVIYCFERLFIMLTENRHQKGLIITKKFLAASSIAEKEIGG